MKTIKIDKNFSGVISVVEKGKHQVLVEYGYADKANKIPNRINTKFPTASAGKVFVATAVLMLIEEGRLSFDTAIGEVLAFDWKKIDPAITVRDLLTHTSGIPDYFDESVMENYEDLWVDVPNYRIRKSEDLFPLFIDKPMMYPRGERFQYNNTGYVVLGLIIEALTGKPFDKALREMIFEPCHMKDTGYYELDRLPANCANAYIYDEEREEYRTNIYSVDAKGTGAGGTFTTAPDVEHFWKGLTAGKLISKGMVKEMFKPQVKEGCYGYGVWLLDGTIPSFQGCDPGVNFITSYDAGKDRTITILSNVEYDVEALHETIISEKGGREQ